MSNHHSDRINLDHLVTRRKFLGTTALSSAALLSGGITSLLRHSAFAAGGFGRPTREERVEPEDASQTLPGPMESSNGGAPETTTHAEVLQSASEELSPEEQAVHVEGSDENAVEARKDFADEDADTAALAEGRAQPPTDTRDEPV